MINQEEYEILKDLDDRLGWLSKDGDGDLVAYEKKPEKSTRFWFDNGRMVNLGIIFDVSRLFQFIQWEDEEPHNISELIGEYEKYKKASDYFKVNIKNVNQSMLDNLPTEREETEMKKDKEWLKDEVDRIYDARDYWSVDDFRDEVLDSINELDNPEVLLQELPVVPMWFDEWWKDVTKGEGNLFHNIEQFYDELFSSRTGEMYGYICSPDNKKKLLNIIVNELEYEVEKEQKYYVLDKEVATFTNPVKIKSIKSNTPITITFNDDNGITLTADSFTFEDAENM